MSNVNIIYFNITRKHVNADNNNLTYITSCSVREQRIFQHNHDNKLHITRQCI